MSSKINLSAEPLLKVSNLSFSRRREGKEVGILHDLNFSLNQGDSIAILGPSGCGKTTLLHLIAGLLPSYQGKIVFRGSALSKPSSHMSVIFQNYGLFPWKRVWENLLIGLKIQKRTQKEDLEKAEHTLEQFGIGHLKNCFISELSEGQRQRLAIARSLILEPDLLILDEPFSSIDSLTKHELQEILYAKWIEKKFSLVLVTHSIEEAAFLGKKILLLSGAPASMQELIENPLPLGKAWADKLPAFCQFIRDRLHQKTS